MINIKASKVATSWISFLSAYPHPNIYFESKDDLDPEQTKAFSYQLNSLEPTQIERSMAALPGVGCDGRQRLDAGAGMWIFHRHGAGGQRSSVDEAHQRRGRRDEFTDRQRRATLAPEGMGGRRSRQGLEVRAAVLFVAGCHQRFGFARRSILSVGGQACLLGGSEHVLGR